MLTPVKIIGKYLSLLFTYEKNPHLSSPLSSFCLLNLKLLYVLVVKPEPLVLIILNMLLHYRLRMTQPRILLPTRRLHLKSQLFPRFCNLLIPFFLAFKDFA